MNLQQALKYVLNKLSTIYENREALNISHLLLEDITNFSKSERLMNELKTLTLEQSDKLDCYLEKLLQHKPLQQVLGYTWFGRAKFLINENVLIPRPETDELVERIILDNKGMSVSIIDIGTGSGCIAISLKKLMPNATVTAIDISTKALELANENSKNIGVDVLFQELDFLDAKSWEKLPKFDIIVSNPPYIKEIEKSEMQKNVLQFEPHLALFVPDNNPLIFYEAIADFATTHLNENGVIWVEINEALGKETMECFISKGFTANIFKDLQGKDRMIKALRKQK